MIIQDFNNKRVLKEKTIQNDLTVVGGGLSGVCTAIAAAREGLKVTLIQDRPVLGGNASSEVRLWVLGATSHMGNNNRWAREGGIVDEILVENMYRNKEGNPVIFDTVLMDKVLSEKNITLLLNTQVFELEKENDKKIKSINAFCSQNSTMYKVSSPLFVDSSGDGILGFLAGASFRMGAENKEEFDEGFAPDIEDYGELLGHTMYFYSKDVGHPVKYVAPDYALKDITEIPRYKKFTSNDHGCSLWWVEYGGRLDTIHDTEEIKHELWKVVYGVWNHIKNSGEFTDAENLTLEWVANIPGKRESRRFIGDYILHQKDVIEQRQHEDAVAHGGWAIDLHPADGVYSDKNGCTQWHSKGVYQIPYRCYYSKDIDNLFLAGRIISVSHVAFGSTRVMGTCGAGGQVVGTAAAICLKENISPKEIYTQNKVGNLQQKLVANGQNIPNIKSLANNKLLSSAEIKASSTLQLSKLKGNNEWLTLDVASGQMIPLKKGNPPTISFSATVKKSTKLQAELRISSKVQNHTPDLTLKTIELKLKEGQQNITLDFNIEITTDCYGFICFLPNENVSLEMSDTRVSGILSVFRKENRAVSNYGKQEPPAGIGVDTFEFWTPKRRPDGNNFAFNLSETIDCFNTNNITNGAHRPVEKPNAWVASMEDNNPTLEVKLGEKKQINEIKLFFDPDYDHPMESAQMGHSENEIPFCVKEYEILDDNNNQLYKTSTNHQTINNIKLENCNTNRIFIRFKQTNKEVPVSLFSINLK